MRALPHGRTALFALAPCGAFLAPDVWNAACVLVGAAGATASTPALGAVCAPFGGHAFTWPFVLTAMLVLAAVAAVAAVPAVPAVPCLRRV